MPEGVKRETGGAWLLTGPLQALAPRISQAYGLILAVEPTTLQRSTALMEVAMSKGKSEATALKPTDADRFVVNGAYLREQAAEAVTLFFKPLTIVFRALTRIKPSDRSGRKPT